MENHKSVEFQLPREIIQHIQSFLSGQKAARTSLLSKSWYDAWSTRPNLVFKQNQFQSRAAEFPVFTKKTMQRYEHLNLKIHTLRLRLGMIWWKSELESSDLSLAHELIVKAMKLGAVDLDIILWNSPLEDLDITSRNPTFVLPDEVLESETLARLSVYGLKFDLPLQRRNKEEVTNYSNLKSLILSDVTVNGDIIRDLILRCPSIEELTLDGTKCFFGERLVPAYNIFIKQHDLWPKLHYLKELVIRDCYSVYDFKDVRICSPSLERISIRLHPDRILDAEFDAPRIRKFVFGGSPSSRLDFKTTSCREWESDIHIKCSNFKPSASWLSSLNQLVKMLSPSRVSLTIDDG